MVGFGLAAFAFAFGCLLIAVAALYVMYQQLIRAHNDVKEFQKASNEALARYGATIMQVASAIEEKVNTRVGQRVKLINTLRGAGETEEPGPPAPPVGDAPAMGTTDVVDEAHEIRRGLQRVRREGVPDELVRDPGVGNEYETGADGAVMHGGKVLEI